MNLKDLSPKKSTRLNKVMESRFGFTIDYDKLNYSKAKRLYYALDESLNQVRKSYGIHTAEKNPKYMEMLMVQEGLQAWMDQHEILTEGELEVAEVVLAAKDMVDSIQKMIEDASKMMNEQLPPLLDSIRDQIGSAQADQFKNASSQALQGLLDNLNATRDALDGSVRMLSGEEMVEPGAMAPAGAEAQPGAMPPAGVEPSDLDVEEPAPTDQEDLSRERR